MTPVVRRSEEGVTVEVTVAAQRKFAGDGNGDPGGHQRGGLLRYRRGGYQHRRTLGAVLAENRSVRG